MQKLGFTQIIMAVILVIVAAILTFNVGIPTVQTAISSTSINWTAIPGGQALAGIIPLLLVVGVVMIVVGGYLSMRS